MWKVFATSLEPKIFLWKSKSRASRNATSSHANAKDFLWHENLKFYNFHHHRSTVVSLWLLLDLKSSSKKTYTELSSTKKGKLLACDIAHCSCCQPKNVFDAVAFFPYFFCSVWVDKWKSRKLILKHLRHCFHATFKRCVDNNTNTSTCVR